MIAAVQEHYLLPDSIPTVAIAGMFAGALAAWVGLHLLKRKAASPKLRALLFFVGVAVGFGVLTAAMQLAARYMLLTTNWRLWPIALIGSAAVEVLLALYGLERRTVSRKTGLTLAGLRIVLLLLVVAMLAQPVLSWELVDEIQRYVAVLVDSSASMYVTDPQRGPSDKLRLAEMLSVRAARRRYGFERIGRELRAVRQELGALGEGLALLSDADAPTRQEDLRSRRSDLNRRLTKAHAAIERQLEGFEKGLDAALRLDDGTKNALRDAKAQLTVGVRDRLREAMKITDAAGESRLGSQYDRLVQSIRAASGGLAKLTAKVADLGEAIDARFYASLPEADRKQIDAIAARTRHALARGVLLHRPAREDQADKTEPSLLEGLEDTYQVKLYSFAGECVEADRTVWATAPVPLPTTAPASAPASGPATAPTSAPAFDAGLSDAQRQRTDLAGAIEKVMTEMTGKQLAGVVMLLDGRHNAPRRVEPLAAQLGLQQVPLCSIVMAPEQPPRDAAVISVNASETVVEKDKLLVNSVIKLDGLAGQGVEIALFDAKRQVEKKLIRVPKNAAVYRTRVQFSDEPKTAGLHAYRVQIKALDGEVFAANNVYPLTVSVTKERTKLLLLEDRPRWEFRYIKNIFADRDRAVKLQYVLAMPDQIAGQSHRLNIPASASRRIGQIEATKLPASVQEWMKFDVIILGDLTAKHLTGEVLDTLRKFVTERGGTLIVIAGPNAMPHAYAKTPLEEILPVRFEPSDQPVAGAVKAGYRIALAAEGTKNVVMFQDVDPEKNLSIWQAVPDVYWRHPTAAAKEGTTVLAYAMPASPPEFLRPLPPEKAGDEDLIRQREAKRRQFQRTHALITVSNVAAGRVMMLSFDRTWRLRYRTGDTYHHRFWGQVLRWATANKLPAGTDFVKLGTDKTRYGPDKPVRVRAKIVQPDLTPVVSQNVAVNVYAGDDLVLRKKLEYVKDSAGMYEAQVGRLASGTYRVDLVAPEAEPILAAEKVKKVTTEFSVDPVTEAEQVELAADRGLLQRLANLSGGSVLEPHQARNVLESLGPKSLERRDPRELRLWEWWPLLVLIVLVATCEWVLRKRVGLA